LPEPGVDYVGPLPPGAQRVTIFSAGIVEGAAQPAAAKALIEFFVSPAALPAITKSGLEPAKAETRAPQAPTVGASGFDAVSVKVNQSIEAGGGLIVTPGMFRGTNISVHSLMRLAFGNEGRNLLNDQIAGGPGWITTERYDVIGRTSGEMRTLRAAAPLIRRLLEERFQLRAHRERRQLTVYALRTSRPDRRLGPVMRRSALDCGDPAVRARASSTPSNDGNWCGSRFENGSIHAGGYAIPSLVFSLSAIVEKFVIDETGLAGLFDFALEWNQDPAAASDKPSLFTALQEQLGLRLVPTTAPVDVIVIDSIQHPSPD
jgi:uncharacterized protein (TIGR03435 family)